jgi:hypothetical protein
VPYEAERNLHQLPAVRASLFREPGCRLRGRSECLTCSGGVSYLRGADLSLDIEKLPNNSQANTGSFSTLNSQNRPLARSSAQTAISGEPRSENAS